MRVLIVYAHPDPQSFNHALKERAVTTLHDAGHDVRVTDLYASGFEAVDYTAESPDSVQLRQSDNDAIPEDIQHHLDNLDWCELLIFQFPIWWFSAPAILKGWFDRVLFKGVSYGGGRKHGTGMYAGRRGLICCTTGTPKETYAPDGVEGDIKRLLWPINNGVIHYLGMSPYRPFPVFAPQALSPEQREAELDRYADYLTGLSEKDELPMHPDEDYDEHHQLRPEVEPRSGFQYR